MGMKYGLVLEGGGLRGIFTAGVVDCLLKNKIKFDYVIGVSAGACNTMAYVGNKYEFFDSFFKNFAGMDTLYDFNTLTDCTSMFIEACSNNPDIYQYADVLADAYLGNTMRLSEFMMGQSDLYNALKAAADTLDNTKASSKYYLRIPVSKKELREIITINNFNIAHNLETLELEEYKKEPIEN